MVKLIRLDERLIHGQVAIKWSRLLGVNRIVVADDEASSNPIMQQALMMAAPSGIKVVIVDVEKAVSLCNDPRAGKLSILLIVSNPESLLRVVKGLDSLPEINIGNYGRVAPKREGGERRALDKNLYVDADEAQCLREAASLATRCVVQTLPDETPVDLERLLG